MDERSLHLYALGSNDAPLVKIGLTSDVADRLANLQSASPVVLNVLWTRPGHSSLERAIHREFAQRRRHGEWFHFGPDEDAASLIDAVYESRRSELNVLIARARSWRASNRKLSADDISRRLYAEFLVDVTGHVIKRWLREDGDFARYEVLS